MTYLNFTWSRDDKYLVWTKDKYGTNDDCIASLEYIRVGAWMSWCLAEVELDVYFSASCLDEIRAKIKELNAKSRVGKTSIGEK